ncbi:MAG TPA: hypothetical protein EYH31_12055 [Anaerolineae bacterium]|nr:hypothetical protein [Anaerolineae bacterium]
MSKSSTSVSWFFSLILIAAGLVLAWWAFSLMEERAHLPPPTVLSRVSRTSFSTPASTSAAAYRTLSIANDVPSILCTAVTAWVNARPDVHVTDIDHKATLRLDDQQDEQAWLVYERFYVPVMRFPTLIAEVHTSTLQALWAGQPSADFTALLVDRDAMKDMWALWGPPGLAVRVLRNDEIVHALWADPYALGLVPFDKLRPDLQALAIADNRITDNRFQADTWPLVRRVWLHGRDSALAIALQHWLTDTISLTNRDPQKLTVLIMTGVTAMARHTAWQMEQRKDYAYPAHQVAPELRAADITHVSNEVPFVPGCPVLLKGLKFCSRPEYLAALEEIGTDIVGLTGNHQNDFGYAANLRSLAFYREHGLRYYGGGANQAEALAPLMYTHHGTTFAFLGANQPGPTDAWADEKNPGSARYDLEALKQAIANARAAGADVVSVELQWTEAYQTEPLPDQETDFQALSAAGADIVTGVQAHQPQAIAFGARGGIILYGLGNFFFDQMWSPYTRQGLVARHTFYAGRHIHTELLPTILENYAQPRWATPEERQAVLAEVFAASGW